VNSGLLKQVTSFISLFVSLMHFWLSGFYITIITVLFLVNILCYKFMVEVEFVINSS